MENGKNIDWDMFMGISLERLHQAIFDVIDNPEKTQQTTAIGTLC